MIRLAANGGNATAHCNSNQNRRSSKIVVRQLPRDVDWEDFEALLTEFGKVLRLEKVGSPVAPSSVVVTYEDFEQASDAVAGLADYHGAKLKVSLHEPPNGPGGGPLPPFYDGKRQAPGGYRRPGPPLRGPSGDILRTSVSDLPLRMAVDAKYVGAIIGMGGKTIREITRESKARCVVDVNRNMREGAGPQGQGVIEKMINIYGLPDNCSRACLRILEVVLCETAKEPGSKALEPELRLRVHNNLIGRLIGKGGASIKKIMEDTGCNIYVSNITELNSFNMERTVTVRSKGNLEAISQAEQRVSAKLRQCWEHDMAHNPPMLYQGMQQYPPGGGGGGGPPPPYDAYGGPSPYAGPSPYGPPGGGPYGGRPMGPPGRYAPPMNGPYGGGGRGMAQPKTEVVHVHVPASMVGALIGSGGSHIRAAMQQTGAHIRVETTTGPPPGAGGRPHQGEGGSNSQATAMQERKVTITGPDMCQNRAQFWVFHRVADQCYYFFEEVRLSVDVRVPASIIGRIIGKAGKNVRELQRMTGALIKIPEGASGSSKGDDNDDGAGDTPNEHGVNDGGTTVCIVGNFNAALAVQNRFRQMAQQEEQRKD